MGISLWWVNMIDRRVGDEKVQRVILNWAEIWPNERTNINFHIVDNFTGWSYPSGRGWWWGSAFIWGDWIFSWGWQAYFNYSWFPDLSRAIRVKIVYQVYWDTTATDVNNLVGRFYYGNNQMVQLGSWIVKRDNWDYYWIALFQGNGGQNHQMSVMPDPWNYTLTWDVRLTPQTSGSTTYPWWMYRTLSDTDGTQIDQNSWRIFQSDPINQLHAANDFRLMLQPWFVVKSVDMYIYNGWATPRPEWFHIPSDADMQRVWTYINSRFDIWDDPSQWSNTSLYFKMPYCWEINLWGTGKYKDWEIATFWTTETEWRNGTFRAYEFGDDHSYFSNSNPNYGKNIRLFKDTVSIPDLNDWWVLLHWQAWHHGVYWNQTEWLISFSSYEGVSSYWRTMQDKNWGATQVRNYGDTITSANAWKYFQRWNNHWFDYDFDFVNTPFIYTPIDVTWYWDGIYYESDVYSKANYSAWFTPVNTPLWF